MAKSYRRNSIPRMEMAAMVVIIFGFILYYLGVSTVMIVQLVAAGLLLTVIIYLVFSPFVDFGKLIWDLYQKHQMNKLIRSTSDIDSLTWSEFEHYVADRLKKQGYTNVRLTEHYDLGIDVVAKKSGVTWGVQVKHYTNNVGADAVRQAVTALKAYKCDRAMVVTNSFFTNPAKMLAISNDCVLVDRKSIAEWH